ncbi:MAG: hypothetical protein ACE5GQ_08700 [Nitrospinales bacterium]
MTGFERADATQDLNGQSHRLATVFCKERKNEIRPKQTPGVRQEIFRGAHI